MAYKVNGNFEAVSLTGQPLLIKIGDEIDRLVHAEENGISRFVLYVGEKEVHCIAKSDNIRVRKDTTF
jgi:hypothetical protein